jgi:hypothetical protein
MATDTLTIEQWLEKAAVARKNESRVNGPDYSLEGELRGLSVQQLLDLSKALDSADRAASTEFQKHKSIRERLNTALHNAVDPAF